VRKIAASYLFIAPILLIAPSLSNLMPLKLNMDSHAFSFQQANADTPSEGKFHFYIRGVDKTGLHKFSGESEGTTYFGSFTDATGNLRINNTLTDSGIDAKILNPDTTMDYCCWNSSATVTENSNGTYTFTLYAYADFSEEFNQFSAVYLTGLVLSDKSTITNVVGITAFEIGDGARPLLTCDLRVERSCYSENQYIGTADGTWQMKFTSDTASESYVTGAFVDTQDKYGAFELIHTGKAKVVQGNQFFAAGKHTVTTEMRMGYALDFRGHAKIVYPAGEIILDKGTSKEKSYQLEWSSFDESDSNHFVYAAMFFDETELGHNILGELYGDINLRKPIDYENMLDIKSKSGNSLYVSILVDGLPEPYADVIFDTKHTSKATLEFVR